jgi:hypothetical protein
MIRDLVSSALLCSILGAAALASPVSDFRDGMDASFDLVGATITSTGAAAIDEIITDDQGAPFCAPKARGTLNIDIDLINLGFPGSIPVTLVGTEISPTRVRWDASIDVNQCLDTTLPDGTPISVLIRGVVVRLTGDLSYTPSITEEFCVARRGVQIQTVGGDADNFIDVTAFALCFQASFTRIDIDVRAIDAQGRGGDDPCPADTNSDNFVNFNDLNAVLGQFGAQAAPGELVGDVNLDGAVDFGDLNAVLAAFGTSCAI